MTTSHKATTISHPRWDGRRLLFELSDRGHSVPCTISMIAMQDLSARRSFKPADLLATFAAARERIEMIAQDKLSARPLGVSGLLYIWSDDFDDFPPSSAPATRQAMRLA